MVSGQHREEVLVRPVSVFASFSSGYLPLGPFHVDNLNGNLGVWFKGRKYPLEIQDSRFCLVDPNDRSVLYH
jgi:hypothetical protein